MANKPKAQTKPAQTKPVTETIPAEDRPMITYREPYTTPEGVQDYHIHVVPVDEWADYEKGHGL